MKVPTRVICAASLLLGGTFSSAHAVCFVDARATGSDSGASWHDAYANLQPALRNSACKEIWVAKGIYKPASDVDRAASFYVNPGVAVYGGFAGKETTRSARNPKANVTVLSGDLGDDDANAASSGIDVTWTDIQGDNSYHVVRMDGFSGASILADTVLDGFTITGGNANGGSVDSDGSGLYCDGSGTGHACSPTLSNLVFSGNAARYGALFNNAYFGGVSSPTLTHVIFSGNFAHESGGAIYDDGAQGGISSPTLASTVFEGNVAFFGGAMYDDGSFGGDSSPTLSAITFSGNGRGDCGGAIYNDGKSSGRSNPRLTVITFHGNTADFGGAMYNDGTAGGESSPELMNITFDENRAFGGGAIYGNASISGQSSPRLTNVTFSGNGGGGVIGRAMFNSTLASGDHSSAGTANPILNNVIMWDDPMGRLEIDGDPSGVAIAISHSIIEDGCPPASTCMSVNSSDPMLSTLSDHGGPTWTMMPGVSSPAIDNGEDDVSVCPATDQRGIARPQGKHCDIGAVERQHIEDIIFKDGFDLF